MKLITLVIALLLAGCSVTPPTAHLNYSAMFVPPHHEPIVGNRVARYRVEVEPVMEWGKLETSLKLTSWGAQRWNRNVGNGIPDAWQDSDWSIEEWRHALTHKATYWIKPKFGIYSEYYKPLEHESWGGHGQEIHYYWLLGIRGRFN
jgi:hypothetical protein